MIEQGIVTIGKSVFDDIQPPLGARLAFVIQFMVESSNRFFILSFQVKLFLLPVQFLVALAFIE